MSRRSENWAWDAAELVALALATLLVSLLLASRQMDAGSRGELISLMQIPDG